MGILSQAAVSELAVPGYVHLVAFWKFVVQMRQLVLIEQSLGHSAALAQQPFAS